MMDFEYCENTFKILDYWKKRDHFSVARNTNNVEEKMGKSVNLSRKELTQHQMTCWPRGIPLHKL